MFIEGLDGGDIFECDLLSGMFIEALLFEGVEVGASEDDPDLLPLLGQTGPFAEIALFNLIGPHVLLGCILLIGEH